MAELFRLQRLVEVDGKEVLKDVNIEIPYENIKNKPIVFGERNSFPDTGTSDIIYIAYDEEKCYIWNGTKYVIIGSDDSGEEIMAKANIKRIEGGNAKGTNIGSYIGG